MEKIMAAGLACVSVCVCSCALTDQETSFAKPPVVGSESSSETAKVSHPAARYTPPHGFGEFPWGAKLTEVAAHFPEMKLVGAATVSWGGKVVQSNMTCEGGDAKHPESECMRVSFDQSTVGGGIEAVGEYFPEHSGSRFRNTGAFVYPVVYVFCAHYNGFALPRAFRQDLGLCGVRMIFTQVVDPGANSIEQADCGSANSETGLTRTGTTPQSVPKSDEQCDENAADTMPNYRRLLLALIDSYGYPDGFQRIPKIIIEAQDGTRIVSKHKHRKLVYRWCPPTDDRAMSGGCEASIVYRYDPESRVGQVLIAGEHLFDIAEASHQDGHSNLYYRLLHNDDTTDFGEHGSMCHICGSTPEPLSATVLKEFQLP